MSVVFRVDASEQTGIGHLMRCITLAHAIVDTNRNSEIYFVCLCLDSTLHESVLAEGFRVVELADCSASTASSLEWQEDAEAFCSFLHTINCSWVVVDHYALDARWETRVRGTGARIMAIDDLANRPHDCDLLLDQNLPPAGCGEQRYDKLVPAGCQKLIGLKYALLREEFAVERQRISRDWAKPHRIVIFYGGGDAAGQTELAIEALSKLKNHQLAVDVIVGAANSRANEIVQLCEQLTGFKVHIATNEVATLFARAHLALAAGGTASWERASLGLPSIVTVVAQNQAGGTQALTSRGIGIAFTLDTITSDRLAAAADLLLKQPDLLASWSAALLDLVDTGGAARVAHALCGSRVSIRDVVTADSEQILAWRNEESVRDNSRSSSIIARAEHDRWFQTVLNSATHCTQIIEADGRAVGLVRYQMEGNVAEVSIFLDPMTRGAGIGGRGLDIADAYVFEQYPAVEKIEAEVMTRNVVSRKMFAKHGYNPNSEIFQKSRPKL